MDGCCLKPLSTGSVCYTTEHNCNTRPMHNHSKGDSMVRGNTHMIYFKGGFYFRGFQILGIVHNQKLSIQIRQTSPSYSAFPPPSNTQYFYALLLHFDVVVKGLAEAPHCFYVPQSGRHSPIQSSFFYCGRYLISYFV